jgi:cytochrome c-type biogenesis protein CcmH
VRLLAAAGIALALAGHAAACAKPRTSLAALEGQVMCPICHTTLDLSQSGAANQIRALIRAKIARCESAGQIKRELVAEYGPAILAAPPRKGFDLLAWWLPIAGIVVGAAALGYGAWRWSRGHAPAPTPVGISVDPELDRRVDEELARFE